MKKILVIGSSGQLGLCIQELAAEVEDVDFIFKNSKELNITSKAAVDTFFGNQKIDYCINCAAYTAVDKAESEAKKAEEVNVEGAKNLATACKNSGATLIHISTDFVFDGTKNSPYTETDVPNPINTYGRTKLDGEKAIEEILNQFFIIRTSWLYSEYGNNFMKSMLRLASEREKLNVVNDQIGTPTYAKDLAEFLLFLISEDSKKYGIYHYSNLGKASWFDFAKSIFNFEEIQIDLQPTETAGYPTPAKRPKYSLMSKEKVLRNFNIPILEWEESLKKALQALHEK